MSGPQDPEGPSMTSDRPPAEALARARWDRELEPDHPWHVAWDDVSPRLRQEQVEFAEADIELLAAAGFRVTPIPDDNTRALAARLRDFPSLAFRYEDTVYEETEHGDHREQYLADVQVAADLLDGQPQDRPDRCPLCDSDNPAVKLSACIAMALTYGMTSHPWHVGSSGDTR